MPSQRGGVEPRLDGAGGRRKNRPMAGDDLLEVDFFAARVGETFTIALEERDDYRLELVEALATGGDSDARQPFSVLFRARDELLLPQAIYRLEHQGLDPIDLFLVPLGPEKGDDGVLLYEAAFS